MKPIGVDVDAKTRTWIDFLDTHLPAMIARDQATLVEFTHTGPVDTPDLR
ncbi:hypothetical protein [Paraburkholderia elongata]|nr:hypothetical protein [Paraburkholderia elongata]